MNKCLIEYTRCSLKSTYSNSIRICKCGRAYLNPAPIPRNSPPLPTSYKNLVSYTRSTKKISSDLHINLVLQAKLAAKKTTNGRANGRCSSYSSEQVVQKESWKIQSGIHSGKSLHSNGSARRGGKYSWENHYGPDKDLLTKEDFLTWLQRKPNNTSNLETKNGVNWWYCTGCDRKWNRVIANCRKSGAISQSKANKKSAVVNIARVVNSPVESPSEA